MLLKTFPEGVTEGVKLLHLGEGGEGDLDAIEGEIDRFQLARAHILENLLRCALAIAVSQRSRLHTHSLILRAVIGTCLEASALTHDLLLAGVAVALLRQVLERFHDLAHCDARAVQLRHVERLLLPRE